MQYAIIIQIVSKEWENKEILTSTYYIHVSPDSYVTHMPQLWHHGAKHVDDSWNVHSHRDIPFHPL